MDKIGQSFLICICLYFGAVSHLSELNFKLAKITYDWSESFWLCYSRGPELFFFTSQALRKQNI